MSFVSLVFVSVLCVKYFRVGRCSVFISETVTRTKNHGQPSYKAVGCQAGYEIPALDLDVVCTSSKMCRPQDGSFIKGSNQGLYILQWFLYFSAYSIPSVLFHAYIFILFLKPLFQAFSKAQLKVLTKVSSLLHYILQSAALRFIFILIGRIVKWTCKTKLYEL